MKKEPKNKVCADKDCNNEFLQYNSTDKYCSFACNAKHFKSLKKTPLKVNAEKQKQYLKNLRRKVALKSNDKVVKKITKASMFKEHFDKQRNKIKRRLRKEHGCLVCEKCNTNSSIQFSTHHIIFRSERPDHPELNNLKNLIHLCFDCHEGFHKEKVSRNYLIKERNLPELFGNIWGYDSTED